MAKIEVNDVRIAEMEHVVSRLSHQINMLKGIQGGLCEQLAAHHEQMDKLQANYDKETAEHTALLKRVVDVLTVCAAGRVGDDTLDLNAYTIAIGMADKLLKELGYDTGGSNLWTKS